MKANIFNHEFRIRLRNVLSWSLAVVGILFVFFAMFTSFADQAAVMDEMLANFPPEFLIAFGMTGLNLATVMGFYSMPFLFVQIALAIQAAGYGVSLVSIEESELTADFLLTKPVSRREILISKLLAASASLAITNLAVWLSSFAAIRMFADGREYDGNALILLLASIAAFQLFFLSVGLLISLLVKRVRSATPYALGLGFGMYALGAFTGIGEVSFLELLTPFKHFDANHIIQQSAYNLPLVLLDIAIILIALLASYWLYLRRNIAAVV